MAGQGTYLYYVPWMEFFEVPKGKAGMLSSNQKEKVLLSFAVNLSNEYTGEDPESLGTVLIIGTVGEVLSRTFIRLQLCGQLSWA